MALFSRSAARIWLFTTVAVAVVVLGVCLSGAGPTILALATSHFDEIADRIIAKLREHSPKPDLQCQWKVLEPAGGTQVIR